MYEKLLKMLKTNIVMIKEVFLRDIKCLYAE